MAKREKDIEERRKWRHVEWNYRTVWEAQKSLQLIPERQSKLYGVPTMWGGEKTVDRDLWRQELDTSCRAKYTDPNETEEVQALRLCQLRDIQRQLSSTAWLHLNIFTTPQWLPVQGRLENELLVAITLALKCLQAFPWILCYHIMLSSSFMFPETICWLLHGSPVDLEANSVVIS